ncbi:MAG TPA: transporter substrate-binding domain-containing protein [Azospirillaceae bacterium]|nr:transporter substrate-binding domain-containing protein [Azospirillaceae bacterium]
MRARLLLPLLLLLAAAAALPARAAPPAPGDCALRFAWTPWEPFYVAAPGGPAGIDHDIVAEAARRAGCTVTWQEMPWVRAFAMLKGGLIDGLAGAQRTREREGLGRFVGPMRAGRNVLFVRRGEAGRYPFAALADLAGTPFRLGVQRGARYSQEYETLLAEGRLAGNLLEANGSAGGITMLVRGRVDGFLEGEAVGRHMARRLGMLEQVEIHPMPVSSNEAYMLLGTQTVPPDVADRLDAALAEMRADGTVERFLGQPR